MSINDECYKSLQIISALERHTLNGRHWCPNRIVIDLIYNLRKQVESIQLKSGTETSSNSKYQYGNTVDNNSKISSSNYKIKSPNRIVGSSHEHEDNAVVIEKFRRSLVKSAIYFDMS